MKDREFLIWLHNRMEHVHGDNPLYDYMHKLRAIIRTIDKDASSSDSMSYNNIEDFLKAEETKEEKSNNTETNLQILGKIRESIRENPQLRFQQILWNLGINEFEDMEVGNMKNGSLHIMDKHHEESGVTLSKLLK